VDCNRNNRFSVESPVDFRKKDKIFSRTSIQQPKYDGFPTLLGTTLQALLLVPLLQSLDLLGNTIPDMNFPTQVGGFNPSEKYESQLG